MFVKKGKSKADHESNLIPPLTDKLLQILLKESGW